MQSLSTMKKTIMVLAATFICGSMFFASCGKDDEINNGSNPGSIVSPTLQWVDLDLPSGLLWADRNLGASTPEDYGNYYAWGETQPKESYLWSTYRYCTYLGSYPMEALETLTKYNTNGSLGAVDNRTFLEAIDDAATACLGDEAYTPVKEEWDELIENTTHEYVSQNGVYGIRFTGANGNSIFLPAAGLGGEDSYDVGVGGYYWSESLDEKNPGMAFIFHFSPQTANSTNCLRYAATSVRAVRLGLI